MNRLLIISALLWLPSCNNAQPQNGEKTNPIFDSSKVRSINVDSIYYGEDTNGGKDYKEYKPAK